MPDEDGGHQNGKRRYFIISPFRMIVLRLRDIFIRGNNGMRQNLNNIVRLFI